MQPLRKTVWRFLKKTKDRTTKRWSTFIPGYINILKKNKKPTNPQTLIQKDTCTSVVRAALFMITEIWKQPKCPSRDEWMGLYAK